jgi:hypothetical protein
MVFQWLLKWSALKVKRPIDGVIFQRLLLDVSSNKKPTNGTKKSHKMLIFAQDMRQAFYNFLFEVRFKLKYLSMKKKNAQIQSLLLQI